jgi:hypothetical protein
LREKRISMKCMNCGLQKSAHIPATAESGRRTIWMCPDGSGSKFPATFDVKVELHYNAGEIYPWVATWLHPLSGPGEVVSGLPTDALMLAGHQIEKALEEKPLDEVTVDEAFR